MAFTDELSQLCQNTAFSDLILEAGHKVAYLCNDILSESGVHFPEAAIGAFLGLTAVPLTAWPNDENHSLTLGPFRFRANFAKTGGHYRAVLRLLPATIPDLKKLRVPPHFLNAALTARRGIILVCGETGSGKSTTLAAVIKERAKRGEHILTIEDPVEYLHANPALPLQFLQREVGKGKDVDSFSTALESGLRQAPKVILIGEIRDQATALIAMRAANTGHLIFSTMHTGTVSDSVQALLSLIPGDRMASALHLFPSLMKAVACQRLVPGTDGQRFAIHEVLMPSIAVTNIIRKGDFQALNVELEQGSKDKHQTFKQSLQQAQKEGLIDSTQRTAIENSALT